MPDAGTTLRPPLVTGNKSIGDVTRDICAPMDCRPTVLWWSAFSLSLAALLVAEALGLDQPTPEEGQQCHRNDAHGVERPPAEGQVVDEGHLFGLQRCSDPTCPRAYPNSLDEHDAKGAILCGQCRDGFDRLFGE